MFGRIKYTSEFEECGCKNGSLWNAILNGRRVYIVFLKCVTFDVVCIMILMMALGTLLCTSLLMSFYIFTSRNALLI